MFNVGYICVALFHLHIFCLFYFNRLNCWKDTFATFRGIHKIFCQRPVVLDYDFEQVILSILNLQVWSFV